MELAAELESSLREFSAAGAVEICENGARIAFLAGLSWEVRGGGEKPLLHLWSEQCNLTRRILAIIDHSEERLALAVERFGRSKPDRLEFVRMDFQRSARDQSRQAFCQRLGRILAEQFPDETLESLTASPDLEHSLSGSHARGLLRRGSLYKAVLGVPDGESSDIVENSLTFGLLWLERARHTSRKGTVAGLRLILPKGSSRILAPCLGALDSRTSVELYELDPARDSLEKMDPRGAGNLSAGLVPHREAQALLDQARSALDPIVAAAPKAVTLHPSPQSGEVWLRFRGLAFACWDASRVFFGTGDSREELTAASRHALKRLLNDLELHRNPLASDTRHPLYRAQAER